MFETLGIIPVLKDSKLRIYAIVGKELQTPNGKVETKTLDDYLEENPVKFSGLGEFAAVRVAVGYCPKDQKARNKYDYNLVKIDPAFRIGSIDLNRQFSRVITKEASEGDENKKVSFADIEDFIGWINNPDTTPKRVSDFETIDGYVNAMKDALKVLTDKLLTDYKFNELVSGVRGQSLNGVVKVKQELEGDITPSIEKEEALGQNEPEPALERTESKRTFSTISVSDADTRQYSKGNLIGTLLDCRKYLNIFHWLCDKGEYAQHQAYNELEEALYEPLDALAEKCVNSETISSFTNEIFPKGDAIDYLSRVKEYTIAAAKLLFGQMQDGSSYQSLIDDIVNSLDHCLYLLKRLSTGQKSFSARQRTFSAQKEFGISNNCEVKRLRGKKVKLSTRPDDIWIIDIATLNSGFVMHLSNADDPREHLTVPLYSREHMKFEKGEEAQGYYLDYSTRPSTMVRVTAKLVD